LRKNFVVGMGVIVVAIAAAIVASSYPPDDARAETIEVLVTSTADDLGDATCPDDSRCTLRQAIETVNVSLLMPGDNFAIRFDPDVFPPDEPATIELETPLPGLTRAVTQVLGTGAGVIIDGSNIPESGAEVTGLYLNANNVKVRGIAVRNFEDFCVRVSGEDTDVGGLRSLEQGLQVDGCSVGILVSGPGAIVSANEVGLANIEPKFPIAAGIATSGPATIGGNDADRTNYVANAERAIAVGSTVPSTIGIRNNVIGEGPTGIRGAVEFGVTIEPPTVGVDVSDNDFAGTTVGISVRQQGEAPSDSTGNTFRGNEFVDIGSMAIDLGEDGVRNPNDPGDADTGPNNYQNHPVFERVVQAEVAGSVPGPCAGCLVELYFAEHRPADEDVPTNPVPAGIAVTNAAGEFVFANPQVSPGDWLMATATDADGNTSEFGPSARVGTGILQCGNVSLRPGWNSAGYFGSVVSLSDVFPPASTPPGPVVSIHRLTDGTRDYRSWFRGASQLSTLTSLAPGEAYWYWAEAGSTVPGSFTLGVPVPIELSEGWNHFVYIGAAEDIEVAFETIEGSFDAVYRYDNSGGTGDWSIHAAGDVPDWVQGFNDVEPCTAYYILMNEDATLHPPQP
jgi:CSLREA domain-containing protein